MNIITSKKPNKEATFCEWVKKKSSNKLCNLAINNLNNWGVNNDKYNWSTADWKIKNLISDFIHETKPNSEAIDIIDNINKNYDSFKNTSSISRFENSGSNGNNKASHRNKGGFRRLNTLNPRETYNNQLIPKKASNKALNKNSWGHQPDKEAKSNFFSLSNTPVFHTQINEYSEDNWLSALDKEKSNRSTKNNMSKILSILKKEKGEKHFKKKNKLSLVPFKVEQHDSEMSSKKIRKVSFQWQEEEGAKKRISPIEQFNHWCKELEKLKNINAKSYKIELILNPSERLRKLEIKQWVYDSWDDEEIEDNFTNDWYFDKDSYIIICIDFLIFVGSFFTLYITPFTLAEWLNFETGIVFSRFVAELVIDIINGWDVWVSFFKPFYNQEEILVVDLKYIFIEYLFTWFLWDAVCAIPFNSWIFYEALNGVSSKIPIHYNTGIYSFKYFLCLLRIIKFVKVWCYNKFTQLLERFFLNFDHFSNWSRVYTSLIWFFTSWHFLTCIFIHIGRIEYPNWISYVSWDTSSFSDIYIASLYFNLTTIISVGYGDMITYSFTEKAYNLILLFFGVMIYSWAVSSMSTHITASQMKYQDFDNKKQLLAEIQLTYRELPGSWYDNILRYLKYKFDTEVNEKNLIYTSLPIGWRNNLIMEMYKPVINNFVFFKNYPNPDFIIRVIWAWNPLIYVKGDILFDEDQILSDLFFVKKGKLAIEAPLPIIVEKSEINELSKIMTFKRHNTAMLNISKANDLISISELTFTYWYKSQIISSDTLFLRKHSDLMNIYQHGKTYIQMWKEKWKKSRKYYKWIEFRENEHFGNSLMFLNKLTPFRARIKSKECEWFTLSKTDATEISTTYPEYWKIIHEKAIFNLEQLEGLINIVLERFFFHYEGEKYKLNPQLIQLLHIKEPKTFDGTSWTNDNFLSIVSPWQMIPETKLYIPDENKTNYSNLRAICDGDSCSIHDGEENQENETNLSVLLVSCFMIFILALLPKVNKRKQSISSNNSSSGYNCIETNRSKTTKKNDDEYSINEEIINNENIFPTGVINSDKQNFNDKVSNCSINKEGNLYNFVENSKEIDLELFQLHDKYSIIANNSFTIHPKYSNVYLGSTKKYIKSNFNFQIVNVKPPSLLDIQFDDINVTSNSKNECKLIHENSLENAKQPSESLYKTKIISANTFSGISNPKNNIHVNKKKNETIKDSENSWNKFSEILRQKSLIPNNSNCNSYNNMNPFMGSSLQATVNPNQFKFPKNLSPDIRRNKWSSIFQTNLMKNNSNIPNIILQRKEQANSPIRKQKNFRGSVIDMISDNVEKNSLNLKDPKWFYADYFNKWINEQNNEESSFALSNSHSLEEKNNPLVAGKYSLPGQNQPHMNSMNNWIEDDFMKK